MVDKAEKVTKGVIRDGAVKGGVTNTTSKPQPKPTTTKK